MSDEQTLSNSEAASRLEVVCDEFERNWERGGRPRIEDFLDRIDPSQRPDLLRELILIECERRRRINETPRRDDYATRFPKFTVEMGKLFTEPNTQQIEQGLLFAVLAFEGELLNLAQLMAACRTWAADKTKPLADLLVERGWITPEDRQFVQKQVARKLAKHQNDPRATLNSVTRGDVCDVLKELGDADINQSLSSWPSVEPMLVETMTEPVEIGQVKSRYSWVSEVGRGGLGKVWLARDNDLAREVALKEIKPGKSAASREAIRRLFKEAQITGQLQHPNIVPVYEMNRGDRPFYTMKLVKGETLSQAIKRHHKEFGVRGAPDDAFTPNHTLAPPAAWVPYDQSRMASQSINSSLSMQRLMSVFLNVCDALAYAHSRGIIHRDLKPQNIVLGDYGEAIVLDWGLARKLDQKEDDAASVLFTEDAQTDATQAGSVLGSPPYMAPEQAAGQTELMDQRTDVYGLGAILFEILTDRAPHRKAESESIVAMLQRITAHETPHVRELDLSLPDELDTICAKAMAKSRDERYPSAQALKVALLEFQVHKESIDLATSAAADLELARQTGQYDDYSRARFGFEEALRQWPNNTRASDGLQTACRAYAEFAFQRGDFDLALSLVAPGKMGTPTPSNDEAELRSAIRLAATERASRQQRIKRLRRFSIAASLSAALFASIGALWINVERTRFAEANTQIQLQNIAITNQNAALELANSSERIAKENAETKRREADASAKVASEQSQLALSTLDSVFFDLQRSLLEVPGGNAVRQRLLATVLEKLEYVSNEFAKKSAVDRNMMLALADMADTIMKLDTNGHKNEAHAVVPDKDGKSSGVEKKNSEKVTPANDRSSILTVERFFRRAHEIARQLASTSPADIKAQRDLAVSFGRIGRVLEALGRTDDARLQYLDGLKIYRELAQTNPSDAQKKRDLSISIGTLGRLSRQLGRNDEALSLTEEALRICREQAEANPNDMVTQQDLAESLNNLGELYQSLGRIDDALSHIEQGLAIRRRLVESNPKDAVNQRELSVSLSNYGQICEWVGRFDEAIKQIQEALAINRLLVETDPQDTWLKRDLAETLVRLGDVLGTLDRNELALERFQEALEVRRVLSEAVPEDIEKQGELSDSLGKLGAALLKLGRVPEAFTQYEAYFKTSRKLAEADPINAAKQRRSAIAASSMGSVLLKLERTDDALSMFQQGLIIGRKLVEDDPKNLSHQTDLIIMFMQIGEAYSACGRFDDAVIQLNQALNHSRSMAEVDPQNKQSQRRLIQCQYKLGEIHIANGQFDQARECFERGIVILNEMIEKGLSVKQLQQDKLIFEQNRQYCLDAILATGDWDSLLKADEESLPNLLRTRASSMLKKGDVTHAVEAANKLRQLKPKDMDQLHTAAGIYASCAGFIANSKPELTDAEQSDKQKYQKLAIESLQQSIAAGWDDFVHLRQCEELVSIRHLPEFEALFPK